ncbi:hypothetical protein RHMOL_Rhmol01G0292100 [Rhododendron molle]|uniref:Uncharacterized protein n=1 Tax=Rhododendron molle TaxID=49168 RepID=A0ACC0Q8T2_RHOML|nr:hypothetical protein RHMOL_Rhmol01G0292100 [Rhododendron molle]
MFKFKHHSFLLSAHEINRLFSASPAISLVDPITQHQTHLQTTTNINTLQSETSNPQSPPSLDPKHYISQLFKCRNLNQITQVHAQVAVNGLLLHDLALANKLLYIYVQHKAVIDAHSLFGVMTEKDPVSWSVMVDPFVVAALVGMYAKCGAIDDAKQLFDKMPERDLVSWTVMIGAYAECGNANESLALFDRMREEDVIPDKVAMVTVVNACAKMGAMHKARLVHEYIWRRNFSLDVILGSAMIDMYAKCGNLDSAREIFDKMREKNVITWSAMIAAYGYHGKGREALELFPSMLTSGVLPNRITFVSLLYACSHAGLV